MHRKFLFQTVDLNNIKIYRNRSPPVSRSIREVTIKKNNRNDDVVKAFIFNKMPIID